MSPPSHHHAAALSALPCLGPQPEAPAARDRWFQDEVAPHEPALRAWLRGQFPQLADLDDVIQEAYLRLLRVRQRQADGIRNVRTFLYGIARHVAIESYRQRRHFSDIPVNDLPDSPTTQAAADVVQIVSHNQELALVVEAVKTLPERCRQVVMLRTQEGLSYKEIAARLGLAEETVRVQMGRAVRRCAQLIREDDTKGRNGA